jgi:hypothetical protein
VSDFHVTPENCVNTCGAGRRFFDHAGHRRVLNANNHPFCAKGMGADFDVDSFIIPREQWPDLISQKDKAKSWLDDLVAELNIPCKDQDGRSLCHAYSVVTAYEVMDSVAGNKHLEYGSESVAGYVTNWSNRGADPEDDLDVLVERGVCEASFMDQPWSLSPSRWKDGWKENALTHRALEYCVPRTKLWDVSCTCALKNLCTGTWASWWSHAWSASYRLKNEKGKIWRKDRNNWGAGYGQNGFMWFSEGNRSGQGTPSGLVIIRVATPTA